MTAEVDEPLLYNNNGQSRPGEGLFVKEVDLSTQIFTNLFSTQAAIVAQIGLLAILGSVYYAVLTNPIILFSGHPLFNSAGLVLLGQGLLLVQPKPVSPKHKTLGGQVHGIINTLGTISFMIGSFFIFYNKHLHGAQHITTWHATFGLTTYILLLSNMLVGVAQFWLPGFVFGSVNNGKRLYKYHRLIGLVTLIMIGCTILLALESDYNRTDLHLRYPIIGSAVMLVVGGILYQVQVSKIKFW
jgi:hypothetical protein